MSRRFPSSSSSLLPTSRKIIRQGISTEPIAYIRNISTSATSYKASHSSNPSPSSSHSSSSSTSTSSKVKVDSHHHHIQQQQFHTSSTSQLPPLARFRTFATLSEDPIRPDMASIINALTGVASTGGMPTPPLTPKQTSRETSPSRLSGIPQPSPAQDLARLQHHLDSLPTPLLKHIHLSKIRREDPRLFFKALAADIVGLAPIVYTPTVGEACQKYHQIYQGPEGLYLSIDDKDKLPQLLSEYAAKLDVPPSIIVVTDGSRILGLGDLGLGGMGISRGKLNLYVAGGGVDPERTLAIVLDMGTNNAPLRSDPLYLGLPRPRVDLDEATEFMDIFMDAATKAFPGVVVQHEDFYSDAAFKFLERFQGKYRMFNDDIQGTGSVILGGFMRAAKIASEASGRDLKDHRIVFLGGGSAAVGVAKEMMNFFTMQGLSEQEARERFWLIDTKGLITNSRYDVVSGKLASHKKYFIRNDLQGQEFPDLKSVVEHVKPTALVGLSTTYNAFTEDVVRSMAENNTCPIIFPLSNPTSKCELSFEDALNWTDGKVLFASGSPYDPITFTPSSTPNKPILKEPGQGNNFLVFPGIGFAAILCKASKITNGMITASAIALSESLTQEERSKGLLYPRTERMREISADVALGVVKQAIIDGVDENLALRGLRDEELLKIIKENQWVA